MQFPITKIYKAMGHFRFEHSCKSAKIDDLIWLMPEPDNSKNLLTQMIQV